MNKAKFTDKIHSIFEIKHEEFKLLLYSTFFIFSLFCSYALLRPIRDALGIHGGSDELKWLFLGTFIATIVCSFVAMWLSGAIMRKLYTDAIFIFFAINLLGFFVAMRFIHNESPAFATLCRVFYIWVSVFNLLVISSVWSVLADVFSKEMSKSMFGIISAGASLGGIAGASLVSFLREVSTQNFIFLSAFLLFFALILKNLIIKESLNLLPNADEKANFTQKFASPLPSKNPLDGFKIIAKSPYLLSFVGFVLLLTSVSTFLYMEQARIVRAVFETREARAAAFANIDLIVQSASFFIQIFLTAKIAKFFGIKWLLALLGFVIALGFILLGFTHPAFWGTALVMSLRRVGEYALVKPAREMLFVPLDSESKYKVKNFLDTVVYRGGDALSSQVEGIALAKFGVSGVLILGAIISFVWGILGLNLSKKYEKLK
ncbi:MAG: MFS transporter [Campylobacter sp.]|nr:MFS transporter [Campylobacter sp.]